MNGSGPNREPTQRAPLVAAISLFLLVVAVSWSALPDVVTAQEPPAPLKDAQSEAKPPISAPTYGMLFDEIVAQLHRRFYDKRYHGVDLEDFSRRHRPEIAAARTRREYAALARTALAEFKASHLYLVEPQAWKRFIGPELRDISLRSTGVFLDRAEDGRWFISMLPHGCAALEAGLRVGDEIVSIDGAAPGDSDVLVDPGSDANAAVHYALLPPESGTLALETRRAKDAATTRVELAPSAHNLIDATRASVSVIERQGRAFGYYRPYHLLSPKAVLFLMEALRSTFVGTDGLILDMRGSGGHEEVVKRILNLIGGKAESIDLKGDLFFDDFESLNPPIWRGPVVALIDESSRSAKEIWAYCFKKEKLGTLVGRPTAGAVLGMGSERLSDGSRLVFPVTDFILDGKVRLEGNPVQPDVLVAATALPYAAGRDDLLEAGIKEILGKMDAAKPGVYAAAQAALNARPLPGGDPGESEY